MSGASQINRREPFGRPTASGWLLAIASVGALALLGVAFGAKVFGPNEKPEQHAARLTRVYGIRVEFGSPSTFFTPPYGPSDATVPGFEPEAAEPQQASIALDGIESALEMYPPGFVDKLIDAIFICGDLRMSGTLAGGAAGPAWIVLSAPSGLDGQSVFLTASLGVHHELSSIVLRHQPATMTRWRAFAPAEAKFVQNASEAIARGDEANPDPSTGFLTAYGSSTPENDFNTYSEMLFSEVDQLRSLARDHDLVKRKLRFVIEAYEAVDASMRDYFVRSGLRSAAMN